MNWPQQKNVKPSFGISLAGAALMLAASAQAQESNPYYFDVKVGPSFSEDTTVQASPYGNSGNVHYDTGVRADVAMGYNLNDAFAVELQSGVIWNNVDKIAGNLLANYDSGADLYQIPIVVNGIYRFPLTGKFKPYVGIGAGGVAGLFEATNVPLTTGRDYSDLDFTFAYQAMIGFKYSLGEYVDLGLAYEFLGTTDHTWTDQNVTFKTDGTMTHSVMATLSWRF